MEKRKIDVSVSGWSDGVGAAFLAVILGVLLFDGEPSIADSLRVILANIAVASAP